MRDESERGVTVSGVTVSGVFVRGEVVTGVTLCRVVSGSSTSWDCTMIRLGSKSTRSWMKLPVWRTSGVVLSEGAAMIWSLLFVASFC